MSHAASRTPDFRLIPRPLRSGLIPERLARGPLLLCLDFDGTIAEITDDPWKATPLPRAKDAISKLRHHPEKLILAIISGRDLDTLLRLLGLREGLLFAGTHGLELIGHDHVRRFADGADRCASDIARLRDFLASTLPKHRGFIVEDKGFSITLNYRNAKPAEANAALVAFDDFVDRCSTLKVLEGKMIHEAIPRGIGGKGGAIEFFIRESGIADGNVIYFGDDLTDEDAFRALIPHQGIGVLVGAARPSFAQYLVDGPEEVADLLTTLAANVDR